MGTDGQPCKLPMAERRAKGLLWIDTGENLGQQVFARGLCQEFNQTKATEVEKSASFTRIKFCREKISRHSFVMEY